MFFPLKHETATVMVEYFDEGRPRKVAAPLRSKFLVKRCAGGELAGFVVSYLPSPAYSRRHPEGGDSLGVTFGGTGYSGFYFVSRLDGRMLHGTLYKDGEAQAFVNVDNYLRLDTAAADYAAALFSMSLFVGGKMTRTGLSRNVGETPNSMCIFCGLPVYGTMCPCGKTVIVEAERCEHCRKAHPWRDYCEICSECKRYPCECPTDPGYDPTTDPDYNPNGGTGSQTGGGGGPAGGRGDGGEPSSGEQTGGGSNSPSYTVDPSVLTSTAENVVLYFKNMEEYEGQSICNKGVIEMFKRIYKTVPKGVEEIPHLAGRTVPPLCANAMNSLICADGFSVVCANVSEKAINKIVLSIMTLPLLSSRSIVRWIAFTLMALLLLALPWVHPRTSPGVNELNFSPTVNMVMRTPWKPHAITTYPRKKCPDSGRALRFLPRGVSLFTVF